MIWSFYCIFGRLFAYIRHRHLIVRPPYVIGSERNEVSSYRSLAGCLKIVNPLWVFEICSNKKWNSEWLSSSKMVDDVKNITETAESKGICAIIVETCHYSVKCDWNCLTPSRVVAPRSVSCVREGPWCDVVDAPQSNVLFFIFIWTPFSRRGMF